MWHPHKVHLSSSKDRDKRAQEYVYELSCNTPKVFNEYAHYLRVITIISQQCYYSEVTLSNFEQDFIYYQIHFQTCFYLYYGWCYIVGDLPYQSSLVRIKIRSLNFINIKIYLNHFSFSNQLCLFFFAEVAIFVWEYVWLLYVL